MVPWEALSRAFVHKDRVAILEVLAMDGGRVLSPNELSFELQLPLSNVSYHTAELRKAGIVEVVDVKQRRGALEHYHRLVTGAVA